MSSKRNSIMINVGCFDSCYNSTAAWSGFFCFPIKKKCNNEVNLKQLSVSFFSLKIMLMLQWVVRGWMESVSQSLHRHITWNITDFGEAGPCFTYKCSSCCCSVSALWSFLKTTYDDCVCSVSGSDRVHIKSSDTICCNKSSRLFLVFKPFVLSSSETISY